MKSMHMRATTGKYDVSMYSISFHSDLSRIFRSAGFMKNIFFSFLCSLLSNEYINEGKKISFLCVSIGAFCVISNTFWSNTTSIRTIWLNARKWELIAICKIWYEFLKICNSWNFLLLKVPQNFADIFQIRTSTFSCRKVMGFVSDFAKFSSRHFYLNSDVWYHVHKIPLSLKAQKGLAKKYDDHNTMMIMMI